MYIVDSYHVQKPQGQQYYTLLLFFGSNVMHTVETKTESAANRIGEAAIRGEEWTELDEEFW